MLKNILNLEGAQKLTKTEQKTINGGTHHTCKGGVRSCTSPGDCDAIEGIPSTCISGCCGSGEILPG